MNPLDLIPKGVLLVVGAALAVVLGAGWGWTAWELSNAQKEALVLREEVALKQGAIDKLEADANQAATEALNELRAKDQEMAARLLENARVQEKKLDQLMVDKAAADHAVDGLRRAAAATAQAASCDRPGTPDPEALYDSDQVASRRPARVLANVLGLVDERAGVLASYADSLRARCERIAADLDSVSQ
jgi:hypothetical protein